MLPIALRTSVRPLGSVLINMILTSSILSTITLNELTGQAKIVASDTFRPFEVYAVLLVVYAALTYLVSLGITLLHRRLNRDILGQVALMRFTEFTPYDLVLLAQGLGVTVGLFLLTSLIGVVVGTVWGVIRFYRVPVLMQVVTFVAEILKNSPVLVQLFLVFFGFPAFFHLNLRPVEAAVITLSANTAAFVYVIAVSADRVHRPRPDRVGARLRPHPLAGAPPRHRAAGRRLLGRAADRAARQPVAGHLADLGDRGDGPGQDRRHPQPPDAEALRGLERRGTPLLPDRQAGRSGGLRIETRLRAHSAFRGL